MKTVRCSLLSALLFGATCVGWAAAPDPSGADFQRAWGGHVFSTAFRVDAARAGVILPPASLRPGDELWIRPLRLNADEYLILQKCSNADCSTAQVVRAWNAYGYMGPYPVLSDRVVVEPDYQYLLWMQRVPTQGTGSFRLYQRDAPLLVFEPAGSPELFRVADLKGARALGPAPINKAQADGTTYVVRFAGGSVVRMQAMRPTSAAL